MENQKLKVLFVASEAYPLIKTGGLADVVGALPLALKKIGVDVRLLLPNYSDGLASCIGDEHFIRAKLQNCKAVCSLGDPLGFGEVRLLSGVTQDRLHVWLLDCPDVYSPELYGRPGGVGPYQDSSGREYSNNDQRFALLSWAGATLGLHGGMLKWRADIVHAHDWQTGLIPAYYKTWRQQSPPVVFTIHNLQYRGVFSASSYKKLGLDEQLYDMHGLEYYGDYSSLKAALQYADKITTVSPTYADEIQTAEFGCGLEGLLRHNKYKLSGILNGIDEKIWNPKTDSAIEKKYTLKTLKDKQQNRSKLLEYNKLPVQNKTPVFGVVSRFTEQKGLDILIAALPKILALGAQLVVLGSGNKKLESEFMHLAKKYPQQVAVTIGYDENYSHLLQAGCDCLLVPSRFEPCGLTQLYALKYGTLPLVRNTGGLADSVVEPVVEPVVAEVTLVASGETELLQTGFVFQKSNVDDLTAAMLRVLDLYSVKKSWGKVQKNAMREDYSWRKAAQEYKALYQGLVSHS